MTDRGIMFSAPMVNALKESRKTQTRRLASSPLAKCKVGDRLWVRETFWIATRYSYGITPGGSEIDPPLLAQRRGDPVHYAADGDPPNCANRHYGKDGLRGGHFAAPDPYAIWIKKPAIHMPRWASRITLVVVDVRIELLQKISQHDAWQEGAPEQTPDAEHDSPRDWYAALFDTLHGSGAWRANPYVVALTFGALPHNIDKTSIARRPE